jgi:RimJ/RimL family protein N-acetyltransferase
MPLLTDLSIVRSRLDRDREWSAYAIGDLAPGLVEHCEWHGAEEPSDALVLIFRGFSPSIVFAMGSTRELRPLFAEVADQELSLHLRADGVAALSGAYTTSSLRTMRRMTLRPDAFRPAIDDMLRSSRIDESHLAAVTALYADGEPRGEAPTFFSPAMLRQGTFHGVWEGGELIAIAGTHLYSAELGVCTIGNVYTRGDRRGRGLAARVTSDVVAYALSDAIATIVLNVGADNTAAQRVYERLGFVGYGEFYEGEAMRTPGPASSAGERL